MTSPRRSHRSHLRCRLTNSYSVPKVPQSQSKASVQTILLKAFSRAPSVLKLRTEIYLILPRITASSHNHRHVDLIITRSLTRSSAAIWQIPLLSRTMISLHNCSQVIVGDFPTPKTIIARTVIGVHNSRLLGRENFWTPKTVTCSDQVQVIQNSLTLIRLSTIRPKIHPASHLHPRVSLEVRIYQRTLWMCRERQRRFHSLAYQLIVLLWLLSPI
jgi:hypothetical protein